MFDLVGKNLLDGCSANFVVEAFLPQPVVRG
jgi:hypothetical protein